MSEPLVIARHGNVDLSLLPALANRHGLITGATGTGKTIAYLLPLLTQVKPKEGSQLLIVTSSQELAMQVATVAREWGQDLGLSTVSLIGGANLIRQQEKLKSHPN